MKHLVVAGAVAIALLAGIVASAQKPVDNVSGKHHPNLAAAQHLSKKAWEKITAAQSAAAGILHGGA